MPKFGPVDAKESDVGHFPLVLKGKGHALLFSFSILLPGMRTEWLFANVDGIEGRAEQYHGTSLGLLVKFFIYYPGL